MTSIKEFVSENLPFLERSHLRQKTVSGLNTVRRNAGILLKNQSRFSIPLDRFGHAVNYEETHLPVLTVVTIQKDETDSRAIRGYNYRHVWNIYYLGPINKPVGINVAYWNNYSPGFSKGPVNIDSAGQTRYRKYYRQLEADINQINELLRPQTQNK